jgi:hypothetical protein
VKRFKSHHWALIIKEFVDRSFTVDGYKLLAALTVNSASEDILKAESAVKRASNRVAAVSDEALQRTKQAKYKAADDYFNEQKAIDAAQKAIDDAEQAAIDREMETLWFMRLLLMQRLYGAQ